MKSLNPLSSWLMIGLTCLVTTGCSQTDKAFAELQDFISEIEKRPGNPVEPLPTLREFEEFSYTAGSVKNPFEPPVIQTVTNTASPDLERPKEPLESYPLDTLRMVGTLSRDNALWAVIRATNDKTVHTVQIGNYLGQNFGRVLSMNDNTLELEELIPNGLGDWEKRQVTLTIDE